MMRPGDMDMPFGYPRISILGSAHYGSGQAQGLGDDLETKKEGSNPYSTRTLVNSSPVAYIKPGRDAPRGTSKHNLQHNILQTIDFRLDNRLDIDNSAYGGSM
jgi:hypothetical protein